MLHSMRVDKHSSTSVIMYMYMTCTFSLYTVHALKNVPFCLRFSKNDKKTATKTDKKDAMLDVMCCLLLPESYTTAQDVLNATQDRLAPRVQRALEGVAGASEAARAERVREERRGERDTQLNPALRGVSQKLLEKVYVCVCVCVNGQCILCVCYVL